MLSDEVIDKVIDRLVLRIEQMNSYVISEIGKSVKQIGTLTPSQAQELVQILRYGGDYDKIVKKIQDITNLTANEIYEIFEEVAKNDYIFAQRFYKYRNIKYIPYEENYALKNQVEALAKITASEFLNFSRTSALGFGTIDDRGKIVYKGIQETYNDLLDQAILNVGQGKETFNQAMYKQLKQIGSSGLRVIYPTTYETTDKNGNIITKNRSMRLDSATRMNLKEGLRTLHNETQKIFGQEFGSDGVEISVHTHPAPDHAEVQGHQFENKEFEKFQTDQNAVDYKGKLYPAEFDGHDRRSISQHNCYHYTFAIILGVSNPIYTDEKLKEIIDNNEKGFKYEGKKYTLYEGEQLLRKVELELRKSKDEQIIGVASGNDELILNAQNRITSLTQKYKEILEISGLPNRIDRARVPGYKRVKISNVEK